MVCIITTGANEMGNCLLEIGFGGDLVFATIIVLLIFAVIFWKTRSSASVVFPIGLILVFSLLQAGWESNFLQVIFNMAIVIMAIFIALAVFKYAQK